jgi:hypothetical protein
MVGGGGLFLEDVLGENNFGFITGKETTDATGMLRTITD